MKDTYTIRELRARYGNCAASTIYRNMITKGFPRGGFGIGSSRMIGGAEIYDWEIIHMPWLHPKVAAEADKASRMDEDEKWKAAMADYDARKARGLKKEREPVSKKGWTDVRREVIDKGVIIKPRHSKKAVAR